MYRILIHTDNRLPYASIANNSHGFTQPKSVQPNQTPIASIAQNHCSSSETGPFNTYRSQPTKSTHIDTRKWHDELYTCDVSQVVGPSYNIFSLESPYGKEAIGPISGESEVIMKGRGFDSAQSEVATIRLDCEEGFIDVSGTVHDDEKISFKTQF